MNTLPPRIVTFLINHLYCQVINVSSPNSAKHWKKTFIGKKLTRKVTQGNRYETLVNFHRFSKLAGHFSHVMVPWLCLTLKLFAEAVFCVWPLHPQWSYPRRITTENSVRDGIKENFLSLCSDACKHLPKTLAGQIKEKWRQSGCVNNWPRVIICGVNEKRKQTKPKLILKALTPCLVQSSPVHSSLVQSPANIFQLALFFLF